MAQRTEAQIVQNWKTQEPPLVSVICTTYNHEPYIKDAIEGFLMQETDFAFEVIIHDDASTDKTAKIVREYAEKYPKIIKPIFQAENQFSQGKKCSVIAIGYAKGEYIAFCEGDDYWIDPLKLQKQINVLEKRPDIALCFHRTKRIFEHSQRIEITNANQKKNITIEDVIINNWFIMTPSMMFRNYIIKEFPEWFYSVINGDYALQLLLLSHGDGYFIDEVMAVYRGHLGSLSNLFMGDSLERNLMKILFGMNKYTNYKYNRIINRRLSMLKRRSESKKIRLRKLCNVFKYIIKILIYGKGNKKRLISEATFQFINAYALRHIK